MQTMLESGSQPLLSKPILRLCCLALLPLQSSCGENVSGYEVQAPPIQPRPADSTPYLGCDTEHFVADRSWTDPVTGQFVTKQYLNSNQVNFYRDGWESRVPSSFGYLSEAHTGESAKHLRIVWIDIRTVDGVAHYHYYGNVGGGISTHTNVLQPWSSSKVYGVAMAFHRLRLESNQKVGATATINGNVSIAHDLDYLNNVSSNRRAGFYKALAGRKLASDMVQNWIRRPKETFGGFYGDSTYGTSQTFSFRSPSGSTQSFSLRNDEYTGNNLSALTIAEMIKRLGVGYKDPSLLPKMVDYSSNPSEEEMRSAVPSLLPEDLKVLLYGSNTNGLGGMMYDGLRDIPHNLGGSAILDRKTNGRWRAFGKGGSGYSNSRGKSEESTGDWVCLPGIEGGGLEFALYAHIEGPNKVARLHAAIRRVAKSLYPELFK